MESKIETVSNVSTDTSTLQNFGWAVATASDGTIELQIGASSKRNGFRLAVSLVPIAFTAALIVSLVRHQPPPLGLSWAASVIVAIGLALFAFWCVCASEKWRLARNRLEHSVGIGRLQHVSRYEDAALTILCRFDRLGRPYYRLYAIVGNRRHLIFARRITELKALATLIATTTGWRMSSEPMPAHGPRNR